MPFTQYFPTFCKYWAKKHMQAHKYIPLVTVTAGQSVRDIRVQPEDVPIASVVCTIK